MEAKAKKSCIFLVEDHVIFRMGLTELINQEEDLIVCGQADNIEDAWKAVNHAMPDMMILDISLKGKSGIDLLEKIRQQGMDLPTLVLSMHNETLYAERAFQAGAKGYIMKQETSESVVDAIRSVLLGKLYASNSFMDNILNRYINKNEVNPEALLTKRELEVFRLIGQGVTTKEIATRLHLNVKTIGTYRERIKEKLHIGNATELVQQAVHWLETNQYL